MDPKKKRLPGFLSPHLNLCVVLTVMCAATVFTNLRMNRRISAFNDTLEELRRREGKETSVHVSDVSAGLGARKKRSASNATPKQNFEKRLQAVEERVGALFNKSEMFSTKFGARRLFSYLIRGRDGRDGKDGPAGPAGLPGKPGIPGNPGVPGFGAGRPGKAGPPGKPGQPGNRGLPGKAGSPGKTGQPGNSGLPGKVGPKGEVGKPGINKPFPGPPGPKGEKGPVGNPGLRGTRGHKGEKGQKGAGKSGVKYVRWGRTTCPGSAQIVYKGIMGGEGYGDIGGGVNYLCLPHNPKYDKYNDGNQYSANLYGVEYEVSQYNSYGDPFKKNIHDHEAPCVVCFVMSRGSMLMIPARNDCPSGWTEEYHGYLMTSYHGHSNQKDFICVDKSPEYVPGSHANRDGALLYPVVGHCGSLPCLPYVNHRELTCAVCTK